MCEVCNNGGTNRDSGELHSEITPTWSEGEEITQQQVSPLLSPAPPPGSGARARPSVFGALSMGSSLER